MRPSSILTWVPLANNFIVFGLPICIDWLSGVGSSIVNFTFCSFLTVNWGWSLEILILLPCKSIYISAFGYFCVNSFMNLTKFFVSIWEEFTLNNVLGKDKAKAACSWVFTVAIILKLLDIFFKYLFINFLFI